MGFVRQGHDKIMEAMLDCYIKLIGKGIYVGICLYFRTQHLKHFAIILEFLSIYGRAHFSLQNAQILTVPGPFAAREWAQLLEGYL